MNDEKDTPILVCTECGNKEQILYPIDGGYSLCCNACGSTLLRGRHMIPHTITIKRIESDEDN
jgi:predicted nucleic acid-binding Zn ribbon protein